VHTTTKVAVGHAAACTVAACAPHGGCSRHVANPHRARRWLVACSIGPCLRSSANARLAKSDVSLSGASLVSLSNTRARPAEQRSAADHGAGHPEACSTAVASRVAQSSNCQTSRGPQTEGNSSPGQAHVAPGQPPQGTPAPAPCANRPTRRDAARGSGACSAETANQPGINRGRSSARAERLTEVTAHDVDPTDRAVG
jgi:hypothetical protein